MALLLLTALLTVLYLQRRAAATMDTTALARQSLSESAASIDAAFATAQDLGDALAEDLTSEALPLDQIPQRLRADLEARPT